MLPSSFCQKQQEGRRARKRRRKLKTPCHFCGHPFDQELLGRYGCCNCHGEGLDEKPNKKEQAKMKIIEKPSQADLQGKLQEYILERIATKGFFFSRGNRDNRSINALQKKGLVKTEVHTTPSGQRIRKVVAK